MEGEGGRYSFGGAHHVLALAFPNLRRAEIGDVQSGDVSIGIYVNRGLLWLLHRFGKNLGWAGAPYSWHRATGRAAAGARARARLAAAR